MSDSATTAARVRTRAALRQRREARRAARGSSGLILLNVVSLIDVVFIVLLYFVCTARLDSGERVLEALVEGVRGGAARDPFEIPVEPLLIVVGAPRESASVRLNGALQQETTLSQLPGLLHDLSTETGRGLLAPDHDCVVVASDGARWEDVVQAYNAVVGAGFTRVSLGSAR